MNNIYKIHYIKKNDRTTTYTKMLITYRNKLRHENDTYLGEHATPAQNAIYDRLLELRYGDDRLPF